MTIQPYQYITVFFCSFFLLSGCITVPNETPAKTDTVEATLERKYDPKLLLNTQWQWIETITPIETITATNPQSYSLTLLSNGKAQLLVDCNRGGGTYEASEGKLSFGQIFSTRMACEPGSQDTIFIRDLSRITSFFIEGDDLYLEMPVDGGTLHFRKTTTPIYKM
jgi:heat shock protein HslJ